MAATVKRQVERTLAGMMKDKSLKPRERLGAAELYWKFINKRVGKKPRSKPKPVETSSLD
jgi:hypothetical protein